MSRRTVPEKTQKSRNNANILESEMSRGDRAGTKERQSSHRWLKGASIGLVLAAAGCGSGAEADGAAAAQDTETGYERIINVEVTPVAPEIFTEYIRLTGTVLANRDVTVSAEEGGVIREILVEKGNRVQTGDPLFRIDDEILRAQVDQARAIASMASETWDRRKRLYEEDQVGSELMYLEARYAAVQAMANLRVMEERLKRTTIRAPIAGILDSRQVEVGTMVGVGTPVGRIIDHAVVKINGGVPERYAPDVRRGARATVTFDVLEDQVFEGAITYVGSAVNPRNRTFPIELRLTNPGGMMKPEMVANISVVRRTIESAIVVPQEAVIRVEDGYVAFVARESGGRAQAAVRSVTLGPAQRNLAVITSGLEEGDLLIVVGQQEVADGDLIRVVEGAGEGA